MSFVTIKEKLKSKLQSISEISEVSDYPNQNFTAYPSAVVRTIGNTSDYETTTENLEVYSFEVALFQELNDSVHTNAEAREIIEGLCDTVRDNIDSDEFLSGISLPSDRVMIGVRPTVSTIGEFDNGKYVIAVIEVACRISKTN
jgi:hypothetical protein